jgi:hypothetical protein
MITVRKDRLSGTPDEVSERVEELSRGMAMHEYMAGTRLRALAVELARHPGLTVSVVTYDDESQELEVVLSGDSHCDAIMIDRDRVGDHCQMTWDRWLDIRNDAEIGKTADFIAAVLNVGRPRHEDPGPYPTGNGADQARTSDAIQAITGRIE